MLHSPRRIALSCAVVASFALPGCALGTAAKVVTAPVRVASKTVDLATTSQSEADEKRGRELRKREEELGKLERKYEKQLRRCGEGDARKCEDAKVTYAEMQDLKRTLPAPPDDD
ncbi:MAG: hypothetical protein AAF127_05675 [Pseudomonadota bacterium]